QDNSTDQVVAVDAAAGSVSRYGTLAQPLHDAAAAGLAGQTLVLGGGASTSFDSVQRLQPGGRAQAVGHLPDPASDLSAVAVGGSIYATGGYTGTQVLSSVLRTTDGSTVARVGSLKTPVRYGALAATATDLYVFGGELSSGGDTADIQAF